MIDYSPSDLNFSSINKIQTALGTLKTNNLQRVTPAAFEARIKQYINNEIDIKEKMYTTENQDIGMIEFQWGHDHDFGSFQVSGKMGTRHIWLLARFLDHFELPLTAIEHKGVLDIGCWTGGLSLILSKFGGNVIAIDDARRYVHALTYLIDSFGLENLTCRTLSLYDLEQASLKPNFDIVFLLGVIYHLSDPIIALRRIYNILKPGAWLCLESMSINSDQPICEYKGPSVYGLNWFVPAPKTIFQWLKDTGFEAIKVGNGLADFAVTNKKDPIGSNRCFAIARRKKRHIISLYGLSTEIT